MQVISEYRKARGIMADVADENATEGVWHNLFLEVDKVDTASVSLFFCIQKLLSNFQILLQLFVAHSGKQSLVGSYCTIWLCTAPLPVFEKHYML